jgi:hypothetical protein
LCRGLRWRHQDEAEGQRGRRRQISGRDATSSSWRSQKRLLQTAPPQCALGRQVPAVGPVSDKSGSWVIALGCSAARDGSLRGSERGGAGRGDRREVHVQPSHRILPTSRLHFPSETEAILASSRGELRSPSFALRSSQYLQRDGPTCGGSRSLHRDGTTESDREMEEGRDRSEERREEEKKQVYHLVKSSEVAIIQHELVGMDLKSVPPVCPVLQSQRELHSISGGTSFEAIFEGTDNNLAEKEIERRKEGAGECCLS